MVRSASSLIARIGTAAMLAVLLLNAGCVGLDTKSWFSSRT